MKKDDRKMVSMKLPARTRAMIAALGERYGMRATTVVEQAIREKAERDGIEVRVIEVIEEGVAGNG